VAATTAAVIERDIERLMPIESKREIESLEAEIDSLRARTPDLARAYFLHEPSPRLPATHLLIRGQASSVGPAVEPGMPAVLTGAQPEFLPPDDATTRRRLSLARWLTRRDHPLTARVIVNRVWQFHFGEGLVRSPNDFGTMGDTPTHPELLDWLAATFVQDGWSFKALHRRILSSNTYQMSKRGNPSYFAEDSEDLLLSHVPYRRLEAEVIRDCMLVVSGQLNRTLYGPSIYPEIPRAALEAHSDPDKIWQPFDERAASRRTVYAMAKRSLLIPMLEVLDACDTVRSAAKRNVTVIAPQALTMLNGEFVNRQAEHFADRLEREAGNEPRRQIERAYLLAFGRRPTDEERARMVAFLEHEADALTRERPTAESTGTPVHAKHEALARTCRILFNLNEFVYSD
jgi:hypothetical protein